MDLASETVPAVNEDSALRTLDGLGVVQRLPGYLGKSVTGNQLSSLHGAESVLLAVAAIPDPVPEQVSDVHASEEPSVPVVLGRVMISEVDGAMAVRQRHSGQVPEDEHESPLLIVHVPVTNVRNDVPRQQRLRAS